MFAHRPSSHSLAASLALITTAVTITAAHGWIRSPIQSIVSQQKKKNVAKSLTPEEMWVEQSIAETMPPAAKLGITVEKVEEEACALTLSMPLEGNTNIHGSAFAGSLYSLCALCSWYTLFCHFRKLGLADSYTVVLKSAEIQYKRPVVDPLVLARCELPNEDECDSFLEELKKNGKASLTVMGILLSRGEDDDANKKTRAEFSAVLTALSKSKYNVSK